MSDAEKPELRPANDNPWYCLATLHGEQPDRAQDQVLDKDLNDKNRIAWNRWMSGGLSPEQRANLVSKGFSEVGFLPLNQTEKRDFDTAFALRSGRENPLLPDPAEDVDFTHTHFNKYFSFHGFLYAKRATFSLATFSGKADFAGAIFSKDACFTSATFSGDTDFSLATFSVFARFDSATFSGDADFGLATFSVHTDFSLATFSGDARFTWATFSSFARFSSATFSGDADFATVTFSGMANFDSATFSSSVHFLNAKFIAITISPM